MIAASGDSRTRVSAGGKSPGKGSAPARRGAWAYGALRACERPRSVARRLQPVALLHRAVVGVDLAKALVPQAVIDLVEVLAHQPLLGLGDASAVRLAGVLERGVIDPGPPRPHRPSGFGLRRHFAVTALGLLIDQRLEDDCLHLEAFGCE